MSGFTKRLPGRLRRPWLTAIGALLGMAGELAAADGRYPFEVRETAGIRRRNDVITLRSTRPEVATHAGGYRILHADKPLAAQFRRVEQPDEPPQLVADFIDHFQPFEARSYVLELTEEPTTGEPETGLTLTETDEAYRVDSSGLVFWTIRKDLRELLDFSWKETDYIAEDSAGLFFADGDGATRELSERPPTRVSIERAGPLAVSLRFDYDDWPPGAHSRVRLEFVRTKSWVRGDWTIAGEAPSAEEIGAELHLRLNGPEALLDFGAGDFVYGTVTQEQSATLTAGPRTGNTVPWSVWHGADPQEKIFTAPRDVPTPKVHGWAHVMDDQRATALAVGDFGETAADSIDVSGDGRLTWTRDFGDAGSQPAAAGSARRLEFWLHFVTMPVHIGARTSPRSMQEPLDVRWNDE